MNYGDRPKIEYNGKTKTLKVSCYLNYNKTEEIFSTIDKWKPDVVVLSNYLWNASLSNLICDYAKKLNPDILCILGGPEFPAGTGSRKIENTSIEPTYDKCLNFFIPRRLFNFDFCIHLK